MTRTLLVAAGAHTLQEDVAPGARCVLVDGARIAWVGVDARDAPAADVTLDLGGAWITPAFVDAHVHATATGLRLTGVQLEDAVSGADALARVRAASASRADPVLVGGGWDDFAWPEQRPPRAAEVSAAAPGRTVYLNRVDGHSCVVDAATLARLPLDRLDGVVRDDHSEPTGWLKEQASEAAWEDVRARIPPAQLAVARDASCARAASLGIASLHEMGHPALSSLEDACIWAQGEWPVEVLVWWADLDPATSAAHGLRPGGDLFLDGSIGSHTAAMSAPYEDSGGHGELFADDEAVAAFFSACTRARRGAGVHAIGDRAIAQALRALGHAADVHGTEAVRACRHRIEHVELATPQHVRQMAALGTVASMQPAFDALWGGAEGLYAARFGPEAAARTNPLAWFFAAGVSVAFSSDSPVTALDPWGAVVAAEQHRGGLGVDRRSAFRAHVLGGRAAAGQDDVGTLRVGARADLAVWSGEPFECADPRALACLATLVAGEVAHGDLTVSGNGGGSVH